MSLVKKELLFHIMKVVFIISKDNLIMFLFILSGLSFICNQNLM
ncbi:hypothetical protein HMPREF1860_00516 [Prevotella amnii]|uniref:Uncharacterized protein n=1 Tax=Prevotella amnii TaxID=419005 RepID=A0A134BIX8_9BACT|nr:hypothetical protein HMPREF1860_00516 [Prevotella amnii]